MWLSRILVAACVVALWTEGHVTAQSAQLAIDMSIPTLALGEIPMFRPSKNSTRSAGAKLDPLAIARPRPTATAPVPAATTAPKPEASTFMISPTSKPTLSTPAPSRLRLPTIDSSVLLERAPAVPAHECGLSYPFGSEAVSVVGKGTFCAPMPICSGKVNGNCPGVQPGLELASRCTALKRGVFGCVQ